MIAEATSVEPPAELRAQVLAQIAGDPVRTLRPGTPKRRRWTTSMLAAAAVVAVGLGTLGVGLALRPSASTSTADQVFAAPDVRTVSGEIPGGAPRPSCSPASGTPACS